MSGVLPVVQNLNYKRQRRLSDVLPIQQSRQKWYKKFFGSRRVTRRQVMRYFTSNDTDQCQNGSSKLLTQFREQPRSTQIVVAYLRLAFSVTKRTNHAPISFDQAQVSQGHTSCRSKENRNTEVHGGGGLELMKPARELASSRPKPCASLKNAPGILPIRRRGQRSAFPSETSRFAPLVLAQKGLVLPWLFNDRSALRPRRIWCVPTR